MHFAFDHSVLLTLGFSTRGKEDDSLWWVEAGLLLKILNAQDDPHSGRGPVSPVPGLRQPGLSSLWLLWAVFPWLLWVNIFTTEL